MQQPRRGDSVRRPPRRPMIPHFQSMQNGRRTAPPPHREPPPETAAQPEIPPFAGIPPLHAKQTDHSRQTTPLIPPELTEFATDLPERLKRMDGETLLLLALLWLLWQDKADRKLLLALVYVLL